MKTILPVFPKEELVWWFKCPNCGHSVHAADVGHDLVELGQILNWKCDRCWTHVEKTVGQDTGTLICGPGPKIDWRDVGQCTRCARKISLVENWLLCTPCRKPYVQLMAELKTEGLVKWCFMCHRALALDANWCDKCGRIQD